MPATSSGGYRSLENKTQDNGGLLEQAPNGGDLRGQVQDAQQGRDERAHALNPYQGTSLDSRQQAEDALASGYRDSRGKVYEGSGPAGNDGDVGA
ncbi:hypothetical protein BV25DRAFT_1829818 [Artomyces pyxidatus]|uniref:Uncharacterized protein n=1 Tax=Artomyces pyxidatus TaxID=48021 RepID=A0ACB8SR71_9AGAM|nr:hypothetical protein BV25DRAFT_1829818 [Artomyces pyxidatus]